MKQKTSPFTLFFTVIAAVILLITACSTPEKTEPEKADPVAANIKMYSQVWDEIMNKGKLDLFNDSNFTKDVVMHASPSDIVGIDSARAYYANFITGFSNIQFTIKDIFGQGEKLVKHWNFKGTHSGNFFGIPATGKSVSLDGTTLVRMSNGKIAEERDFFDNMDFMTQLGLIPAAGQ
ncbi:MAG: ester cyclase [Chitinophagaceae bacterium]